MKAYLLGIVRLEAREALRGVTVTAIGSGRVKEENQHPILDGWREAAGYDRAEGIGRMSREQARVVLGSMGIGVKACPTSN